MSYAIDQTLSNIMFIDYDAQSLTVRFQDSVLSRYVQSKFVTDLERLIDSSGKRITVIDGIQVIALPIDYLCKIEMMLV